MNIHTTSLAGVECEAFMLKKCRRNLLHSLFVLWIPMLFIGTSRCSLSGRLRGMRSIRILFSLVPKPLLRNANACSVVPVSMPAFWITFMKIPPAEIKHACLKQIKIQLLFIDLKSQYIIRIFIKIMLFNCLKFAVNKSY